MTNFFSGAVSSSRAVVSRNSRNGMHCRRQRCAAVARNAFAACLLQLALASSVREPGHHLAHTRAHLAPPCFLLHHIIPAKLWLARQGRQSRHNALGVVSVQADHCRTGPQTLEQAREICGWREGDRFLFGYGALLASNVWRVPISLCA